MQLGNKVTAGPPPGAFSGAANYAAPGARRVALRGTGKAGTAPGAPRVRHRATSRSSPSSHVRSAVASSFCFLQLSAQRSLGAVLRLNLSRTPELQQKERGRACSAAALHQPEQAEEPEKLLLGTCGSRRAAALSPAIT